MHSSIVGIGNLTTIFSGGKSPMYNRIAQMSVLYEDMGIEFEYLRGMAKKLADVADHSPYTYGILYHLRRMMISLMEFRSALNQLSSDPEYKKAIRQSPHKNKLKQANKEFERHAKTLQVWRNNIGGHFLMAVVEHATSNFAPEVNGKFEWTLGSSEDPTRLKVDYAADIVISGLGKTLGLSEDSRNWRDKWIQANEMLGTLHKHAVTCMYSLVAAFILPRMEVIADGKGA